MHARRAQVWHNYSFDRHVLANTRLGGRPLEAAGFYGDTMHMARMWDSSRKGKGYSLEALSGRAHPFHLHLSLSLLSSHIVQAAILCQCPGTVVLSHVFPHKHPSSG